MPAPPSRGWLAPNRLGLLLSLGGISLFTFLLWLYPGPGRSWLIASGSLITYTIAWILIVATLWPTIPAARVASGVLIATFVLELMKLGQPEWLQSIQETLLRRFASGIEFRESNFLYYTLGAGLGWLWLRWLQTRLNSRV